MDIIKEIKREERRSFANNYYAIIIAIILVGFFSWLWRGNNSALKQELVDTL